MQKQDLKNLLENIYHLLAEEAPPILPSDEPDEDVQARVSPDRRPRYLLRDTDYTPTGPGIHPFGPWTWGWLGPYGKIEELWPPTLWGKGTPPYGPGGYWVVCTSLYSKYYGRQYYVYPPSHWYNEKTGTEGLFSAWWWDGKQFIEEVPAWGNNGGFGGGGGGQGGGGGGI